MFRSKRSKIIGTVIFVIGVCVVCCMNLYWGLVSYDPKETARERVTQALNAAYEGPTSANYRELIYSCSGFPSECWSLLEDEVKSSSNQYNMEVVYYNWEDGGSMRGGDEIAVEVEFANGTTVVVYTYESCVEFCFLK